MSTVWQAQWADIQIPAPRLQRLNEQHPATIHGLGRREVLCEHILGLICSVRCPGSIVIQTFDAIRELRDAGLVVAGGFHSPMEKECLDFLLRGEQPVIVCPAKGLALPRLPTTWRAAIDAGRVLLLSPFGDTVTRTTQAQAETRNEFIAALAHAVLIPHASPGGKAEVIARHVLERGQPLFTFDDEANAGLLKLGARPYNIDEIRRLAATGTAIETDAPRTSRS